MDWGGHVHPSFPRVRFSNFSKSVEKTSGGGGLIFTHSEHSFPSLRTFISLIHSLIYSKFSGSLPHAGNSSILPGAHSKVKIINTNLRASMSDERLEHLIKCFTIRFVLCKNAHCYEKCCLTKLLLQNFLNSSEMLQRAFPTFSESLKGGVTKDFSEGFAFFPPQFFRAGDAPDVNLCIPRRVWYPG